MAKAPYEEVNVPGVSSLRICNYKNSSQNLVACNIIHDGTSGYSEKVYNYCYSKYTIKCRQAENCNEAVSLASSQGYTAAWPVLEKGPSNVKSTNSTKLLPLPDIDKNTCIVSSTLFKRKWTIGRNRLDPP